MCKLDDLSHCEDWWHDLSQNFLASARQQVVHERRAGDKHELCVAGNSKVASNMLKRKYQTSSPKKPRLSIHKDVSGPVYSSIRL